MNTTTGTAIGEHDAGDERVTLVHELPGESGVVQYSCDDLLVVDSMLAARDREPFTVGPQAAMATAEPSADARGPAHYSGKDSLTLYPGTGFMLGG